MQTEIPDGWTQNPFADFATESRIDGGNGATAKKLTVKLYGKGVVPKEEKTTGSTNTKYFRRRAGQLIYSKLDFLNGAFALIPAELDGRESTADLPAFDLSPGVNPTWLLEYVKRPSFYERTGIGAIGSRKARRVSPKAFGKIKILTPPPAEQEKIAAVLASVDDAIQATEAVIEQTRRVKDGLLQDLLTRGIGHTRFKQTEIGKIPESWDVRPMADLADENGMVGGPFGSDLTASDYVPTPGVPVIRGANVSPSEFNEREFVYVTEAKAESLKRNTATRGDLIMTQRGASLGQAALIPHDSEFDAYIVSQTMMRMTPNPREVLAGYLIQYVTSPVGQGWLQSQQTGNAQPHLNLTIFRSMPAPVPPLTEQEEITARCEAMDDAVEASQARLHSLGTVKAGLLQDLLTGAVRVSP